MKPWYVAVFLAPGDLKIIGISQDPQKLRGAVQEQEKDTVQWDGNGNGILLGRVAAYYIGKAKHIR